MYSPFMVKVNFLFGDEVIFFFFLFTDLEECWESSNLKEDEFEEFCVYIVHDRACERVCPNRAQASLPRNLTLKPSQNQVNNVST